jgi:hypothetical protein
LISWFSFPQDEISIKTNNLKNEFVFEEEEEEIENKENI